VKKTIWKICLIVVVLLFEVVEAKAVDYEITIFGTLGGDRSYAYGINDSGVVVGESRTGNGYESHAFIWENGVMTDMGVLGVGSDGIEISCAQSINNLGQIVGYSTYNFIDPYIEIPTHAFLWENGEMYDIGSFGGDSYAYSINNYGQIVGMSRNSSGKRRGFVYENGNMQDIGVLEKHSFNPTYAYGINDNGQIVGMSYTSNGYNAFLWDGQSGIQNLGTIDNYASEAVDLNEQGQIIGSITARQNYVRYEGVIWENGTIIPLGYLERPHSSATAINDLGQIVGCSQVLRGNTLSYYACLWEDGEIFNLNQSFPAGAWTHAYGINNRGQVVGYVELPGVGYRGFVMTPVPVVYYVDAVDGNDLNDGLTPETAFATIQKGVDTAKSGDTIIVEPGVYTGDGDRDIDFLGKAITVKSENGPETCIIDCNGTEDEPHRGFYFHRGEDANSILDGFTIVRGYAPVEIIEIVSPRGEPISIEVDDGGAIFIHKSNPTIKNCILSRNKANGWGGGVACIESSPLVINTTLQDNVADAGGGGIRCHGYNEPTIINCNFSNNLSYYQGGAIYVDHSSPNIISCRFIKNTAKDHTNCAGGAIMNNGGRATIRNCLFIGNSAGWGGGILNLGSSPILNSCTFSENSAVWEGGGIGNYAYSHPMLINCVLWANKDRGGMDESAQIHVSGIQNLPQIDYCCVQGWTSSLSGIGNIGVDPCFVELGYWADANDPNIVVEPNDPNAIWVDGDYHLKSEGWSWDVKRNRWTYDDVTSCCIDAGNPGSPLGEELLSIPDDPNNIWGQNLRINMGAYGGTAEASMPPYDWAILGDLTNDGLVNLEDYAFQASGWLNSADQQPGDLNRDGLIDISDLVLLTDDWLRQTTWHEDKR